MNLPLKKYIELPYYDSKTLQFQLKENGSPVDISSQTLILYIKSENENFTPIEKNISVEGWYDDPVNGIFHIVIDTSQYAMTPGKYLAEIEWTDRKTSLVFLEILVFEDIKHTL